jgi:hypothetical protein
MNFEGPPSIVCEYQHNKPIKLATISEYITHVQMVLIKIAF